MTEELLYVIAAVSFSLNIEPPALFTDSYLSEEFFEIFRDTDYSKLAATDKNSMEYLFYLVYFLRKYYQYVKNARIRIDFPNKNEKDGRMLPSHPSESDAREYAKTVVDFIFYDAYPSEYDVKRFSLEYMIKGETNLCIHSYINKLCDYSVKHRRRISVIHASDRVRCYALLYKQKEINAIKTDSSMPQKGEFADSIGKFYLLLNNKYKNFLNNKTLWVSMLKR